MDEDIKSDERRKMIYHEKVTSNLAIGGGNLLLTLNVFFQKNQK
jgi:hypothetical protein